MLEQLTIKNFQSHKDTTIAFHPGVNALVGISDSGKSAVLRAIYWVLENRPSGEGFVSHWNRSDDGLLSDTSVTLLLNGKKIVRLRNKSTNTYFIDNVRLDAVGRDVPQEVLDVMNMTDVNVQRQLDAPFLLSQSSGEVARFFNKIIKLDDIDKVLSTADSVKRETKQTLLTFQSQIQDVKVKIQTYDWIENAKQQAEKLRRIDTRRTETKVAVEAQEHLLLEVLKARDELATMPDVELLIIKWQSLDTLLAKMEENGAEHNRMFFVLSQCHVEEKELHTLSGILPACSKVDALESVVNTYSLLIGPATKALKIIQEYQQTVENLEQATTMLSKLVVLLPEVCPECGQPLPKESV